MIAARIETPRQMIQREGRRWDIIYMGILREEWMENYGYSSSDW